MRRGDTGTRGRGDKKILRVFINEFMLSKLSPRPRVSPAPRRNLFVDIENLLGTEAFHKAARILIEFRIGSLDQ